MKKFKFTIIMAIYKVEEYLAESIESIINQDIDFQKNVQLILVNDGSPDNSERICKKYSDLYPNNITYIFKENGGVSTARNTGLNHVKGELVNFCDPDDILPSNVLREVYKFYLNNKNQIDFITIPLVFFEARKGLHDKYNQMGKVNRIIDLEKEPYNFILSSSASFYRSSVFDNLRYDEEIHTCEDAKVNLTLYLKNKKFGYVCQNGVKYLYRQRHGGGSYTSTTDDTDTFQAMRNMFSLLPAKIEDDFLREIIIYQLRARIRMYNPEIFSVKEDRLIREYYTELLSKVGYKYLFKESTYLKTRNHKVQVINFLRKMDKITIQDNIYYVDKIPFLSFEENPVCLKYINFEHGILTMHFIYYNLNVPEVKFCLRDQDDNIINPYYYQEINTPYDLFHEKKVVNKSTLIKYKIDVTSIENIFIGFKNSNNNKFYNEGKLEMTWKLPFTLNYKGTRYFDRFNKKLSIGYQDYKFTIDRKTKFNFKYKILTLWNFIKIRKRLPIFRLFVNKEKYILINDRPVKSGDNGEAIFKYINQYHAKDLPNTYFVIDKISPDYKRLKKYGKVVSFCSLKHKYLYVNSKMIVTSHLHPSFYKPFANGSYRRYADMLHHNFFWLQHGVAYDDLSPQVNKYTQLIDKAVVSTKDEANEFLLDKYCYEANDVILTGLPRFDKLVSEPQKIITIAPTWRKALSGRILPNGTHEPVKGFTVSDFYKNYSAILTNKKIKTLLKKNGYIIKFLLHSGMENYKEHFDALESENIKIISSKSVNYAQTFKESKLLITDYSSIFFDFAYLEKPAIFFHFDAEDFFSNHYKLGYFDYTKDGFGDIVKDIESLLKKIEFYFNNDFQIEKKYLKRIEETFSHIDKNNCERVYNEIIKLKREKE